MSDIQSKLASLSPSKRALFELLRKDRAGNSRTAEPAIISKRSTAGPAPLAFAQQRLWYLERTQPGTAAYNVPVAYRLRGPLDRAALERSLLAIVTRHDILRTQIVFEAGQATQRVDPSAAFFVRFEDVSAADNPETMALGLAQSDVSAPFDISQAPLIRALLIRAAEQDHFLVVTIHHIVCDGWSVALLIRDFERRYAAELKGQDAQSDQSSLSFADYAAWQRESIREGDWASDVAFWREKLKGAPPALRFHTDRPRPAVQTFRGAKVFRELSRERLDSLRLLAEKHQATLFMALVSVFQILLFRVSGQDEFVIASPVAGRDRTELESVVGFFVNMLPLRARIVDSDPFSAFLQQTRDSVVEAFAHQSIPIDKLIEELRVERVASHMPLFQAGFGFTSAPLEPPRLQGVEATQLELDTATAKFDLTLEIIERPDGLFCSLEYNTDLFDETTAERWMALYEQALTEVIEDAGRPLRQIGRAADQERALLLDTWSGFTTAYPRDRSIVDLFEEQARLSPDRIAVSSTADRITYSELNRRANVVAHALLDRGVETGEPVALSMERSPEILVAILGILKAGGAYVPLDPAYPAERRAFMLEDSGTRFVLTLSRFRDALPATAATVLAIDEMEAAYREPTRVENRIQQPVRSDVNPPHRATATSLAYVMYTSGSTGKPKGVPVPHRAVVRLVRNTDFMRLDPDQVFLQFAAISFDAATLEIWGALLNGGRIVLYEGQAGSVQDLANAIRTSGVTCIFLTSALFHLMVEKNLNGLAPLRQLLFGGDVASLQHVRTALQGLPGVRLINCYGPTENTTFTTCATLSANGSSKWTSVPIGHPIANTRVYILDADLQPVPIGVSGELYAGGDGLALGYWKRPELTGERFLPNPFGEGLMYKTGDRARWLADGNIEFLGRADDQVKVRGFRIEPGEIESALNEHPDIASSTVVVQEGSGGERRLVAYFAAQTGAHPEMQSLRRYLKGRLPEYMVPSACIQMDRIPLTSNGKIDRKALPSPDAVEAPERTTSPATVIERKIAGIWQKALGLAQVGREDNFFELGGHSLLLIQVHADLNEVLREHLAKELAIVDLFRYPTVRSLAEALGDTSSSRQIADVPLAAASRHEPIAIVAMTGRFPGAGNLDELWRNLRDGVEAIRDFSDEELRAAGVSEESLSKPNYVKRGTVLEGADQFDARLFGMNPREAEITDPQHRLFLECAHEALERAGCDPQTYSGRIGVFAGSTISTYWTDVLGRNPGVMENAGLLQTLIGNDKDFVPTRVAYKLNLRGPAVNVQTACSTSLVAVHIACESLQAGSCEMAIAGGVSIRFPQPSGYPYQTDSIMSPDGRCRPFDERAQGTVGGNGIGVVVLKRLSDALADGDPIEAVILGSAINNDGSNKVGYTAPSVDGQAAVIRAAQSKAGVEPASITVIEAHGTGTNLGDPIEVAALKQVFTGNGAHRCALSSVKGNLGHLDAAAGITGLIKAVLQIKYRQIASTVHFENPSVKLGLADSPFYVPGELEAWEPREGYPLRAAVSSFGMGGTNAHLIVEQPPVRQPAPVTKPWQLLTLSAKTRTALDCASNNLAGFLRANSDASLADVAWTLQTGRTAYGWRRTVVAETATEAAAALEAASGRSVETTNTEAPTLGVTFLFPGQGSQSAGMGRQLYETEPLFRSEVDGCAEMLLRHLGTDLREILFPAPAGEAQAEASLRSTEFAQPALFVIEYALAKLWISWNIVPEAMIGHSIGEYVAACLSGVMTLDHALELVTLRGRLMQSASAGAMLSVPLSQGDLAPLLNGSLSLAAVNASSLCVVAGPYEHVEALEQELSAKGLACKRLHTSHAFHSAAMDPILERFENAVARIPLSPPAIPYVSNVTGTWVTAAQATSPAYWSMHLRQTVRFSDGVQELLKRPDRIYLEAGPGNTLTSLVRKHAPEPDVVKVLPSMPRTQSGESERAQLLRTLGALWRSGLTIQWKRVHGDELRQRLVLPTYPYERSRYWVQPSSLRQESARKPISDWFYVPSWERAVDRPRRQSMARQTCLLFAGPDEFGTALEKELGLHHSVIKVARDSGFRREDKWNYAIDSYSSADYSRLLDSTAKDGLAISAIVHAWSLSATQSNDVMNWGYLSVLYAVQACGSQLTDLLVAGTRSSDVLDGDVIEPIRAIIPAGCRVVPREYAHITSRYLDVPTPSTQSAQQIAAEFNRDYVRDTMAIRGRRRWFPVFRPVSLPATGVKPEAIRQGGVYLITGGLGGAGLAIAEYLAHIAGAKLILTGRTGIPERADWKGWLSDHGDDDATSRRIRAIERIEASGGEVFTAVANAGNADSMRAAIDSGRSKFGPIHGVIHAAGVPGGGLIPYQTSESIQHVFEPKIAGTDVLLSLMREETLDFLVLFSSQRSFLGAPGRFDYCAANAFLDASAQNLSNQSRFPVYSILWDTWAEVGMGLAGKSASLFVEDQAFAMRPAEAVEAFGRILDSRLPVTLVSTRALEETIRRHEALSSESLAEEMQKARASDTGHQRPDLGSKYTPPRDHKERILASIWERLLGVNEIGIFDNFFDLGGDSVVSIQMIGHAAQLGIRITAKQVYEHQTISELAAAADTGPQVTAEQGIITGPAPLAPIQAWFLRHEFKERNHFNQAVLLREKFPLDQFSLNAAVDALWRHHDALRSRFRIEGGQWTAYYDGMPAVAAMEVVDLSATADADLAQAIEAQAGQAQRSLNLAAGPIARFLRFDCGPRRAARLLFLIHHLAIDLISWRIILDDFETAYQQASSGKPLQLPAKTSAYRSWTKQIQGRLANGGFADQLPYWIEAAGISDQRWDRSTVRPQTAAIAKNYRAKIAGEPVAALLRGLHSLHGVQMQEALLASLADAFLADRPGVANLLVDVEGVGREAIDEGIDVSRTVGWFTPVYPVAVPRRAGQDWPAHLAAVRKRIRAVPMGGVGYAAMRFLENPARQTLSAAPQAQVNFLYLGQTDLINSSSSLYERALESPGPLYSASAPMSYPISVEVSVQAEELFVDFIYNAEIVAEQAIVSLGDRFVSSLLEIAESCQSDGTQQAVTWGAAEFGWDSGDVSEIAAAVGKLFES